MPVGSIGAGDFFCDVGRVDGRFGALEPEEEEARALEGSLH